MIFETSAIVSMVSGLVGAGSKLMDAKSKRKDAIEGRKLDLELARLSLKDASLTRIHDKAVMEEQNKANWEGANLKASMDLKEMEYKAFNTATSGNHTDKGLASYVRPLVVFWGMLTVSGLLVSHLVGYELPNNPQWTHLLDIVELSYLSIVSVYAGSRIIK